MRRSFALVTQAGLEFLCSIDLPALDPQSARIIGVSHCTQPSIQFPIFASDASCVFMNYDLFVPGFHHVGQSGLELMNHCAQPVSMFLIHSMWLDLAFLSSLTIFAF